MIRDNSQSKSITEKADSAFRAAAKDVIERARRSGTAVVVWRDNRMVSMTPDEAQQEYDQATARQQNRD